MELARGTFRRRKAVPVLKIGYPPGVKGVQDIVMKLPEEIPCHYFPD